jgi:hypothetical protein
VSALTRPSFGAVSNDVVIPSGVALDSSASLTGEKRRYMELIELAEKWEYYAKNRFLAAEQEKDDFGKRFIEHGAMCYFNCAQELKAALILSLPLSSTTQLES